MLESNFLFVICYLSGGICIQLWRVNCLKFEVATSQRWCSEGWQQQPQRWCSSALWQWERARLETLTKSFLVCKHACSLPLSEVSTYTKATSSFHFSLHLRMEEALHLSFIMREEHTRKHMPTRGKEWGILKMYVSENTFPLFSYCDLSRCRKSKCTRQSFENWSFAVLLAFSWAEKTIHMYR